MHAAVPRGRPGSEEDDKGRQAGLHGRPGGQTEEAANRGEQRQVYKITKLIGGKYRMATDMPIVDKQGRLVTTEAGQDGQSISAKFGTDHHQQLRRKY